MSDPTSDAYRAGLLAEARRRFGDARAEALTHELEALAVDLARVAEAPLSADSEPGFYLLTEE